MSEKSTTKCKSISENLDQLKLHIEPVKWIPFILVQLMPQVSQKSSAMSSNLSLTFGFIVIPFHIFGANFFSFLKDAKDTSEASISSSWFS